MLIIDGLHDLFVNFLHLRARRNWKPEGYRILLQMFFAAVLAYLLIWLLALPIIWDTPWNLPIRLYTDTFGPFSRLLKLQPVLLERSRFEEPSNMWRIILWPSDSFIGSWQDSYFGLWNWVMTSLINGPGYYIRLKAWLVGCACCGAVAVVAASISQTLQSNGKYFEPYVFSVTRRMYTVWVKWTPESLLFLEQLFHARELGRKLSPAVLAEMDEYEELEAQKELLQLDGSTHVIGRAAEDSDPGEDSTLVRQR
mmetsp:Transcript_55658/g.118541  ORF Transcript_55658/g.118541 Transcript_55658/m.118541 type:complete len:254 (-) Transcript_55658:14-775(-)